MMLIRRSSRALSALAVSLVVGRASAAAQAAPEPRHFAKAREGTFGGTRLQYDATVEETILKGADGKPTASIFTTSYIRTDGPASERAARPVVFVFNGGPGSSSIWLHMGFVGPRRVDFRDVLAPETAPPFRIVDNTESPLDVADLVLLDPPGTGYSRILPDGKPEQFYGVQQDALAMIEVIDTWLRRHGRTDAPRYLMGESYGTVRAAAMAKLMAGGPTETGSMTGLTLNGIILLGQALEMRSGDLGDDRGPLTLLPTYAATACYHKKARSGCSPDAQADAARRFAGGPYLRGLWAGSALGAAARDSLVTQLAALTGLSREVVLKHDLRVSTGTFARELLGAEGKMVGLYDARYTLPLASSGNDVVADDPAMGQYVPGFVGSLATYLRDELGVVIDAPYEAISFRSVNGRWDYGQGPGAGAGRNFAADLAVAMRRNPQLRLMVGSGAYDLVTSMGAAEYMVAHSGLPQGAVTVKTYASGHMPYLGEEPRRQLARDVRAFLRGSS